MGSCKKPACNAPKPCVKEPDDEEMPKAGLLLLYKEDPPKPQKIDNKCFSSQEQKEPKTPKCSCSKPEMRKDSTSQGSNQRRSGSLGRLSGGGASKGGGNKYGNAPNGGGNKCGNAGSGGANKCGSAGNSGGNKCGNAGNSGGNKCGNADNSGGHKCGKADDGGNKCGNNVGRNSGGGGGGGCGSFGSTKPKVHKNGANVYTACAPKPKC